MPRFNYESELATVNDYLKQTGKSEVTVSKKFFDKYMERNYFPDKIKWTQMGIVPYGKWMLKRGNK